MKAKVVLSEDGRREELGLWGKPGQGVFAAVTRPSTAAFGAAVICPSQFTEHLAAYPQDVWLARSLAARGVTAARLHYRGTGHSGGRAIDLDFDTMKEDVVGLATQLVAEGGERVVIIGTRLGALVAIAASTELGGVPMVLVEPCIDAGRFLAEVLRVRRMREVLAASAEPAATAELVAQLEADTPIDALGYEVTPRWWRSFGGRTLDSLLTDPPRPTYVVAPASGARAEVEAVVATRVERGWPVTVVPAWDPHDWWLMNPRPAPNPDRLAPLVAWSAEAVRS